MLDISTTAANPEPDHLCVVFSDREVVIDMRRGPEQFWRLADVRATFGEPEMIESIGYLEDTAVHAVAVRAAGLDPLAHITGSLYTLLGRTSDELFALYGRALQMLNWRRDHRYCGRCGGLTASGDSGRALHCEPCRLSVYPRISPCVIVAVTRGDSLLLAAAKGRRADFFSTLAGFIEPGETAEQAVAREVFEEVGLVVENVSYFASQSWPFPGQLMLGFYADSPQGALRLAPDEIEEAGWFTRDTLPTVPPAASISGQLIRHFFATGANA